jgi:CRISPR type III-B/RAMP module RAMP protein Cmr1
MKKFEVLTLKLSNMTPTMIGGYKASTFSSSLNMAERFRVSELKGIWRWWFRALAMGALWDVRGYIGGEEVKKVQEKVRAVLGSTKASSKFILQAYAEKEGDPQYPKLPERDLPPRLQILKLAEKRARKLAEARDKLYYYEAGDLEYTLRLLRQPRMELPRDELRAGVGSLLMALLFQGVGAITRRGFGAWKVQVNEDDVGEGYRGELKDYVKVVEELNETKSEEDAREAVNSLIRLVCSDFLELMGSCKESKEGAYNNIPPHPLVSSNDRFFRFTIKSVKASSPMDLLVKIGKATMKAAWKGRLYPPMSPRDPDGQLHTWILGLPRGQKEKRHGYAVEPKKFELGRRPSAISIRPLKRLSDAEWLCMVYGFLSRDWPETIYHVSPRFRERRVEEIPVRTQRGFLRFNIPSEYDKFQETVFNAAFDMVIKCL